MLSSQKGKIVSLATANHGTCVPVDERSRRRRWVRNKLLRPPKESAPSEQPHRRVVYRSHRCQNREAQSPPFPSFGMSGDCFLNLAITSVVNPE